MDLTTTKKSVLALPDRLVLKATTHIRYEVDLWDITNREKPLLVSAATQLGPEAHVQDFTPKGVRPIEVDYDLTPNETAETLNETAEKEEEDSVEDADA